MADNDKLYDYATLKNEKGKILYPKTKAEQVKYYDPNKKVLISQSEVNDELVPLAPKVTSQELRLKNLEELVDSLKENLKFKGVKSSEEELPIPAEGENADGWFAIVTVKNGKDKWYIYDAEEGWLDKGEATTYIYEGVKVLNGKEPVEGALVINASDIAASINGESKTIQDVLTSLSNEQNDLANEVRTKNHVLYMTESQMEQIDEIQEGQVVVCVEDGVYTKGAIYKLISGIWEEMVVAQEKHLYGTLQEPIVLIDLEDGDYVVHNYMKPSNSCSSSTAIIDYASYAEKPYAEYRDNFLTSIHISIEKNKNSTYEKNVIFKNYSTIGHVSQEAVGTSSAFLLYGGPNPMDTIVKTTNGVINSESMSFGISMETPFYDAVGVYGYNSIFGSEALTTNNEKEYIPTKPYHPSTKKYVDQSTAIRVVEDIDNDYDGVNLFTTNKETGENNKLFMVKEVLNYSTIASNELIYKPLVKIDESIINYIVPDDVNIASTEIPVEFYKEDKITKSSYYGSLKISFTNRIITRIYWNIGGTTKNIYYKEQWTNEPMLLNINSLIPVETYPYIKIINHEDLTSELNNYILIESKEVTKDEVMLKSSSSGGTTITDTLTLSKEVFVPEVPAKEGAEITGVETPEGTSGYQNYGFTLNENGYYESQNKYVEGTESYSLCKVTFNVTKDMNVVWDVINSGEANCDYGIIGNLDADLNDYPYVGNDEEEGKVKLVFRDTLELSTQVTYENVSAGSHYIMFKYVKDGSGFQGNDSLQFKLADESKKQDYVPSYTYESKGEIKVDDKNNLQINGETILTEKDKSTSFLELTGTDETPINLYELDYGSYKIKGKIRTTKDATELGTIKTYDVSTGGFKDTDSVYVIVYEKTDNYIELLILNGYIDATNIIVSTTDFDQRLVFTRHKILGQGSYETFYVNLSHYVEGSTFNDAINNINKKIQDVTPIVSVNDPTSKNTLDDVNRLYSSTDETNTNLYYSKITKTEKVKEDFELEKKMYNLTLDKSILDVSFDSVMGDNEVITSGLVTFQIYDVNDNFNSDIWVDLSIRNGKIEQIYTPWGTILYDMNNGWAPAGDIDDNSYNITKFFSVMHNNNDTIYLKPTSVNTDLGIETSNYLSDTVTNYTITPIKIGQSIKEIADPTSVTEEKYKNDFGTSTNVEDEALYYYKSTGAESGGYSPLTTNIDYDKVLIDKNLASYYPQNGLGEVVTIVQLDIKDESKNKLGSITIQADISPVGELFRLFYQETDIGIYAIEVGTWGEYGNDSYYDVLSYVKTISGYENAKYLSVASNISQDTYPDIYENGYQKYFVGEVKQAAVKPVRVALYSDLENAGGGIVKEITGTTDNPINLWDLDLGFYFLNGSFILSTSQNEVKEVKNGPVLIQITQPYGTYKTVHCYNSSWSASSIEGNLNEYYSQGYFKFTESNGVTASDKTNTQQLLTSYDGNGGTALRTNSNVKYEPKVENDPIQKWYVDQKAAAVLPVIEMENPTAITDVAYLNRLIVNTDITDNNLYFIKKTQTIIEHEQITLDTKYPNIIIDKNIVNQTISGSEIKQTVLTTNEYDGVGYIYLIFTLTDNKITKIEVTYSSAATTIYENGEWTTNAIGEELIKTIVPDAVIQNVRIQSLKRGLKQEFFLFEKISYNVKPFKIALTEA